jgi:hypothetical protein
MEWREAENCDPSVNSVSIVEPFRARVSSRGARRRTGRRSTTPRGYQRGTEARLLAGTSYQPMGAWVVEDVGTGTYKLACNNGSWGDAVLTCIIQE